MPKIEALYAFVAEDSGPDDEGIIGMNTAAGWMPLIGADIARSESIRKAAEGIASIMGKKVKLLKFSHREVLEEDVLKG